jgi:ribose transport system substrate-binding protein
MKGNLSSLARAALIVLVASGCSSEDGTQAAEKKTIEREAVEDSTFKPAALEQSIENLVDAIAQTETRDMQLDVILKNLTGYWEPVAVGANRALGELDVTGGVSAPQEDDGELALAKQVVMTKEIRQANTDGIGLAPLEVDLIPEIDAASEAGIPVVLIDSDLVDSERDLYIGTINAEAGKTAGTTLLSHLGETSGTVVILGNDDAGWKDGYDRTMGARDVLEAAGYTVSILKADWSSEGANINIAAMRAAMQAADPPVVGMLGMFSNAYQCAQAAEQEGRTADDITIVAFDFEPQTVVYMQSGLIKATHAQRQYYMGYLTPYVLYGMKVLGKKETKAILREQMVDDYRLDAGLDVVSAEKLDDYYSFLDNLGAGGS